MAESLDESVREHFRSVLAELSEPLPLRVDTSALAALSAAMDVLVARLASYLVASQLNFDEQARRDTVPPPFMAPRLLPDFVDRPGLGAELTRALGHTTPVVLTGAGGFGKTRLAVWACHQVQDQFPHGVLWVDLGQHPNPEQLVSILADLTTRLTGAPRPAYETVPAAVDAFVGALGDRRLLLVVDDAWREPDVEPFLTGGPRCVRLVTTRRPPVVAGKEIRVDAMSTAEAEAVLRSGLRNVSPEELAPLLARSGRWPLALAFLGGILRGIHRRHGVFPSSRPSSNRLAVVGSAGLYLFQIRTNSQSVTG